MNSTSFRLAVVGICWVLGLLSGCDPAVPAIRRIRLHVIGSLDESARLQAGETIHLHGSVFHNTTERGDTEFGITALPSEGTTWKAKPVDAASFGRFGQVTFPKPGKVTIWAVHQGVESERLEFEIGSNGVPDNESGQ